MHVVEFFATLVKAVDIEVVKARLPKAWVLLGGIMRVLPDVARHALFKYLEQHGRIAIRSFADQEVYMLGHNDVSNQKKAMPVANFCKNFDEEISSAGHLKERKSLIATERYEVQVAATVIAFEACRQWIFGSVGDGK